MFLSQDQGHILLFCFLRLIRLCGKELVIAGKNGPVFFLVIFLADILPAAAYQNPFFCHFRIFAFRKFRMRKIKQ